MKQIKCILFLITVYFGTDCASATEIVNAVSSETQRTFTVDYENNQFLMDGNPFRFIGGSFHYFRALPETWQRKLRTMRAAGLNAVTTYIEWSIHNPEDGVYNWEGIADLEKFIKLAQEEDLYVILRPGPYICAERDMGGFPYWLLHKYPAIQLRTADINYLNEVRLWYSNLMPKIVPHLYENDGPVILVSVENEYGSFYACDKKYLSWLKNETVSYVRDKAVLFTNDGPNQLGCGKIPGLLAGLDFGPSKDIDKFWELLRKFEPKGPLINAEYYPGWLTHWQEKMQRTSTYPIVESLKKILDDGANVNFYMFYGGTNFGFTAGANDGGPGRYNADVTSYDYDAPMDESGDPTSKYMALRDVIGKYLPLPNITVPARLPKMKLPTIFMKPLTVIFSHTARNLLGSARKNSTNPLTFEAMGQGTGFLLYETTLPTFKKDPSILKIDNIADRAYVFVDRILCGVLSRENRINSLPLSAGSGTKLQIFVENQGRINFNIPNDFKGIIGAVRLNGEPLRGWSHTGYPFKNYEAIEHLIQNIRSDRHQRDLPNRNYLRSGPTLFYADFQLNGTQIFDSYLDATGWGKGLVFLNGFNLGRYWPLVGPQITLYAPRELFKTGKNNLVLLELQSAPDNGAVTFTDVPNLDGNN